jgi:hypothetical protein
VFGHEGFHVGEFEIIFFVFTFVIISALVYLYLLAKGFGDDKDT